MFCRCLPGTSDVVWVSSAELRLCPPSLPSSPLEVKGVRQSPNGDNAVPYAAVMHAFAEQRPTPELGAGKMSGDLMLVKVHIPPIDIFHSRPSGKQWPNGSREIADGRSLDRYRLLSSATCFPWDVEIHACSP